MVSIDIGTAKICACQISGVGRNLKVESCKIIPVEKEIITDDNVVFNESFYEYMKQILDEYSEKEIAVTFSMLPVISNDYTLPYIPQKRKMEEMVKAKVFQSLSEIDYIADYSIIDIYKQEKAKLCTVSTYVAPRAIVSGAFDIIKKLGKIPKLFKISQDIAMNYANTFLEPETVILAYLSNAQIMLHLINQPNKIITRNTVIDGEKSYDVLGEMAGDSPKSNIINQAYEQISKLVQYQAIKYTGMAVGTIYIHGECANDEMLKFLKENLTQKVEHLPRLDLSLVSNKEDIDNCFYALYAIL